MALADKTIQCSECGVSFVFSVGEQEFFASKGYMNEPKRCPACRKAKKRQSYGGGYRSERQMFPVTCARCGKETEVPFEPRDGRPVYCSDCYNIIRQSK